MRVRIATVQDVLTASSYRRGVRVMCGLRGTTLSSFADLSSLVPREADVAVPGSMDCEAGCTFVAAGWPLAYLVDRHGTSPSGSVSLLLGFLGDDNIRKTDFWLTLSFWMIVSLCVRKAMKRFS